MKIILPHFAALVTLIACGDALAAPLARNGDRLVAQAVSAMERHSSVTARLRHQAAIGGTQLYGVGSYWQLGSSESMRVRMELQMAGLEASLLQVCNSRFLWTDRRLPTGRTVSRIDLRQLRSDPKLADGSLAAIAPGTASWSVISPGLPGHSGGLASLLAALGENFAFLPPQSMRLAVAPPLSTETVNIPVYAVVGHWKPERMASLTRSDAQGEEAMRNLPARLPQEVLLLLGQANLFPYRIEYRPLETPRASDEETTAPYQLSATPLAVLELSDVTFDVPIDAGQFDYNPRDVDWTDRTSELVERLHKTRQAELATRENESSAR